MQTLMFMLYRLEYGFPQQITAANGERIRKMLTSGQDQPRDIATAYRFPAFRSIKSETLAGLAPRTVQYRQRECKPVESRGRKVSLSVQCQIAGLPIGIADTKDSQSAPIVGPEI
jgi:hypothetical protein